MRDGNGTVPMPILGLYNLSKGVELIHSLFLFPQLSSPARRGIPFAVSLGSASSNTDSELPGGCAADTTPYGRILALLVEQQAKQRPLQQQQRQRAAESELEDATTRMVALFGSLREELFSALQTVRHVAVLYAALLELTYRPATTATQVRQRYAPQHANKYPRVAYVCLVCAPTCRGGMTRARAGRRRRRYRRHRLVLMGGLVPAIRCLLGAGQSRQRTGLGHGPPPREA